MEKIINKNILMKFLIIMFFLSLISLLWINDINFNSKNSPLLLLYLFYSIALFFIPGIFITSKISTRSILERISISYLTGIIFVSLFTFFICAILNIKLTFFKIILVSIVLTLYGIIFYFNELVRKLKNSKKDSYAKIIGFFIIITVVWCCFMASYDPNEELIFSIDRWVDNDLTTCWLNATLLSLDYVKDIKSYNFINERRVLETGPNITLGNVMFSSVFLELFQLSGWRFLYLTEGIFIGIFLYFISLKRMKVFSSTIVSLFCCCNPFILNMNNPDRNIIAVMISVFLYYLYLKRKRSYFIIGIISGVLISTGLRHIPIIIVISFFYLYFFSNKKVFMLKKIVFYFLGSIIPLLIIYFHYHEAGFQGTPFWETHSLFGFFKFKYRGLLAFPFIDKFLRDPFYCFPVIFNNLVMLLKINGYLFCSLSLTGAYFLFKRKRNIAISLGFIVIIIYLMLGVQADWLNREKLYPLSTIFISLFIFIIESIYTFFTKSKEFIIVFFISFLIFSSYIKFIETKDFNIDKRIYKYYYISDESNGEIKQYKKIICNIGFFPDMSKIYYNFLKKNSFFEELKYNKIKNFKSNRKKLFQLKYTNNKNLSNIKKTNKNLTFILNINKKFFLDSSKYEILENKLKYSKVSNIDDGDVILYKMSKRDNLRIERKEYNNNNLIYLNKEKIINNIRSNIYSNKIAFSVKNNSCIYIIRNISFSPKRWWDYNIPIYIIKNEALIFKIINKKLKLVTYKNDFTSDYKL